MKGLVEDKELAFEALKATQMKDDRSLGLLKEHGYIPWNLEPTNETVAKALEYCEADDGVAKVAKMLGKTADQEYFYNRSRSYKKYWDPKTRFLRAISTDWYLPRALQSLLRRAPHQRLHRGQRLAIHLPRSPRRAWPYLALRFGQGIQ